MMSYGQAELKVTVCALVMAAITSVVNADTVYQDSFTGTGVNLSGTTPDITTNSATWLAGSAAKDNGTLTGGAFSAVLPFQPQPGNLYTLSATMVVTPQGAAVDTDWIALGFAQTLPSNLNARWLANNGQPVGWAISRASNSNLTDSSFAGFGAAVPGDTAGTVNATTTSADNIVITLDTSALEWAWTVDFNNDGVDRSETLATTPNINYIGFSQTGTLGNTSTLDNLLLTRTEVATNKWNVNGGGNFNDGANWTMGLPASGSIVTFGDVLTPANTPAVVSLNSAATLSQVRFANGSTYKLDGPATLTLTGDPFSATPSARGSTIATFSGSHEVAAQISGSNGLRKFAAGTLILSNGTNNFTGDVTVSGGTLGITTLEAINQASGVVNVATGATFQFAGNGAGGGASGTLTELVTGAGTVNLRSDLTTEVINFGSANAGFTGNVTINGGTLRVSNSGALGSVGTTAAVGTQVSGGAQKGKLELNGLTVTGERLQIDGRNEGNLAPALTTTGTSRWEGLIVGNTGGNQYNIEAQAGSSVTITGNISMPDDTSARILNLMGAAGSSGRIESKVIDRTVATGDGAENINVSLVKKGAGTWTIATKTGNRDDFHQLNTVVEQGTLAVESDGANVGELWSRTIDIRSGAAFDISTFSSYSLQVVSDPDNSLPNVTGDEVGQEIKGSGTINTGSGTIQAFEDSIVTPGDSIGALNITGNYKYSTFSELGTGRWNYELAATTTPASNDRVIVSGTATIDAGDADDAINLNVTPVQGALATGDYALVQAGSVAGTATNSNYKIRVRDTKGNDIAPGMRQTLAVSNSATAVNLNVSDSAANLSWDGTAGSEWDVKTSNNWTGAGGPQFNQLDNVTFGNVANKNVNVSTNVAPGTVNFSGGVGSTYTVTGTGGMTGFAPVTINSGTVKLQNTGNSYAGATTVASGARLEMAAATTGGMTVNGTLAISGSYTSTLLDNFNDGNISEYTTYTTLDQIGTLTTVGPPDDIVYSSTGTAITANGAQSGNPAPEQAIAIRAAALPIGQSLVVDTRFNTTSTTFQTVGIAIADSAAQVDVPAGNANADLRKSYIFSGMRLGEPVDGHDARSFKSNGTNVGGGPGNIGDVTQLIITRISADDYTMGYSKDNMVTRVTSVTATDMDWSPDSVGFYADIRGAITPNIGNMDNLRFGPGVASRLQVNGDFTLGSTGLLEFDISQDNTDSIAATGAAMLQGTINVNLDTSGYLELATGRTFTILTAASGITNAGMNLVLPANFSSQIVNSTSLVLTYGLPGDYNGDGNVNGADYVVWRKTSTDPNGYTIWRQNFGAGGGAGAGNNSGAVPEPTTLITLVLGCCATAIYGRARRRS